MLVESKKNNTINNLSSDSSFIGSGEDVKDFSSIIINASCSGEPGLDVILYAEFAHNNKWSIIKDLGSIVTNDNESNNFNISVKADFFRIRVVNTSEIATENLNVSVFFSTNPIIDDNIEYTQDSITVYGYNVDTGSNFPLSVNDSGELITNVSINNLDVTSNSQNIATENTLLSVNGYLDSINTSLISGVININSENLSIENNPSPTTVSLIGGRYDSTPRNILDGYIGSLAISNTGNILANVVNTVQVQSNSENLATETTLISINNKFINASYQVHTGAISINEYVSTVYQVDQYKTVTLYLSSSNSPSGDIFLQVSIDGVEWFDLHQESFPPAGGNTFITNELNAEFIRFKIIANVGNSGNLEAWICLNGR